jgi:membrane protease YdiL (CAAX protease family)
MSDMSAYPAQIPQAPLPPARHGLFFGPNGLRAGWGLLLFALLAGIVFMAINCGAQIAYLLHPTAEHLANPLYHPLTQIAESFSYIVAVVIAAILLARRGTFLIGKTVVAVVLLSASCGLLAATAHHLSQIEHQRAAESKGAMAATPAAAKTNRPLSFAGNEALVFGLVLLISWLMSRIEHRRFGEYGLGGNRRRWPQLGQGALVGFGALSVLILFLYLGHWIAFGGMLLHSPGEVLKEGFLWLIAFILVGFVEEFSFRGYLQFTLARGIGLGAVGFFIAALVFNLGFGFAHGNTPAESPMGMWAAGLFGFVFCISLWYTRSLWWAIGFHATWDWGQSYFYGTANGGVVMQGALLDSHPQGKLLLSGGPTGPEGSALCLSVIMLIALFVWVTLRRERNKSTNQALINPLA